MRVNEASVAGEEFDLSLDKVCLEAPVQRLDVCLNGGNHFGPIGSLVLVHVPALQSHV